jgi:hypothetical protein
MNTLDNIWLNKIKFYDGINTGLELRIDLSNNQHYAIQIYPPYGIDQIHDALLEGARFLRWNSIGSNNCK